MGMSGSTKSGRRRALKRSGSSSRLGKRIAMRRNPVCLGGGAKNRIMKPDCHRGSARGRKRLGGHEQGLQERLSCMVLSDIQHPAPRETRLNLRIIRRSDRRALGLDPGTARSGAAAAVGAASEAFGLNFLPQLKSRLLPPIPI
jgi:hypothetical protein